MCLSEAERARLRALIGAGTAPARQLAHARILLKADQGDGGPCWAAPAIAGSLEVCTTIACVRRQYAQAGLEAALNRCWPERVYQRVLHGEAEAHLVALACGAPIAGHQRWSLRLLAAELVRLEVVEAVSHETIRRALRRTI